MGFDVNNMPIKTEWVAFSRISSKIEFYISCLAWPVDENLAWQIYQWVTDKRSSPVERATKTSRKMNETILKLLMKYDRSANEIVLYVIAWYYMVLCGI